MPSSTASSDVSSPQPSLPEVDFDKTSELHARHDLAGQPWRLWLAGLLAVVLVGWLGVRTLSGSEAVTHGVEERIQRVSGLDVEIHTISPGLRGVELHGFRAIHPDREIEFWADVVRLDLEVQALRNFREHDLPVLLEGVRITLPDGRVFVSKRVSALRQADGIVESRGRGSLADTAGEVEWDVTATEDLQQIEGLVTLDGLALAGVHELLADALPSTVDLRQATADGKVAFGLRAPVEESAVTPSASDEILWDSDLVLSGLTLRGERLAEQPIRDLEVTVEGRGSMHVAERRLGIDKAKMRLEGVDVLLAGQVESKEDRLRLDVGVRLPETTCDSALRAIPAELLGSYSEFRMSGAIAGTARLALDTQRPEDTIFDVKVEDRCVFREAPEAAGLQRFSGPFRLAVLDEEGDPLTYESGPGTQSWADFSAISPFLVKAVMAHEDATFPEHHGFAVFAIENALEDNLRAGRVVRGASTISMQLAKNLFLDRDKTVARKVREVVLTWWLEKSLAKHEIMELYLNVIEYGPRLYGIRQAAQHYFGVEPVDLTPAQSVFLATLLPNPVARHEQFERGRLDAGTRREIAFLLRHMHGKGRLQTAALEYGLWELDLDDFFDRSWTDRFFGPSRPSAETVIASHDPLRHSAETYLGSKSPASLNR